MQSKGISEGPSKILCKSHLEIMTDQPTDRAHREVTLSISTFGLEGSKPRAANHICQSSLG